MAAPRVPSVSARSAAAPWSENSLRQVACSSRYDEANRKIFINKTQGFTGISKPLFEFQVGGYKVMDKWLKDRKGRELNFADIDHYTKVAAALTKTIRLRQEIDETIPNWPIR